MNASIGLSCFDALPYRSYDGLYATTLGRAPNLPWVSAGPRMSPGSHCKGACPKVKMMFPRYASLPAIGFTAGVQRCRWN